MRAPFQVLVIPYKIINNEILYGIFLRSDMKVWQAISGGGEDNETPIAFSFIANSYIWL